MDQSPDDHQPQDARRTWLSRRALVLHLTIVVVLPTFIGLCWWQIQRVRQGNTLSWAYVFEWPFFAGYAVYLWWQLVHDQPEPPAGMGNAEPEAGGETTAGTGATLPGPSPDAAVGADQELSDDDRELAAYNRYLADLDASGRRKHW